ncbi:TRL-like family protein [Leptospira licerasiae]|uniref:TRL-like family protein n=1 Tax=Leptospira licerasiae TaxID=447106 RepID=UPI003CD0DB6F
MVRLFIKSIITISLLAFSMFNCATGPVNGSLFTSVSFPGEFNTANNVSPVKKAESCTKSVLGLFTWGDSGAGTIALENKITKISAIDHSTMTVLNFIYREYCTIVTGE